MFFRYRYYYGCLTEEQKKIYNTILSGLNTFQKEISIPLIAVDEVTKIYNFVLWDNPMVFYVRDCSLDSDVHNRRCEIIPNYLYKDDQIKDYSNIIIKYLQVFNTQKNKQDINKEQYVHDYCLSNFKYDNSFGDNCYSILGLILNKTAVCQGIAHFVKLAHDYLSVPSIVVFGKANNPASNGRTGIHVWNIVNINRNTYHLDVTFDMTLTKTTNRYDYFNLSDDDIIRDHVVDKNIPACVTKGQDYYTLNSMTVNGLTDLGDFFKREIERGKMDIIVRINNITPTDDTAKNVQEIACNKYIETTKKGISTGVSYNSNQSVFEINFK